MDFLRNFLHHSLGVIIEGSVVILLIIVLNIIAKQIILNIYRQSKKLEGKFLKENFVSKVLKPIRCMVWLVGASYLLYIFIVRLQLENNFQTSFRQFRNIVVIICCTWLCFEVKKQLQYSWVERSAYLGKQPDRSKLNLISKLFSAGIILVSGLIILDTLGVHIGALLALGGVGGLTLGLAAKDAFANFFGGFMLHITKPFSVGELVHSLDLKMYGTVENIGFYLTRMRGLDRRPFYVPNSMFSSQIVVNQTRMSNWRIRMKVGIRYDDFNVLEDIVNDIRKYLIENPLIDKNLHRLANFVEYADSSLDIEIYTYTKTTVYKEYLQVQQDLLIEVGKIIAKHGAEMAYPTSTLHLNNKTLK